MVAIINLEEVNLLETGDRWAWRMRGQGSCRLRACMTGEQWCHLSGGDTKRGSDLKRGS